MVAMEEEAERSFSEEGLTRVREAVVDAAWLTGRGYPGTLVVDFVAKFRELDEHQRRAMGQGSCSEAQYRRRMAREMMPEDVERRSVAVDAANALGVIEAALEGRPLLESIDGVLRELRGAKAAQATDGALERLGAALKEVKPSKVRLYVQEGDASLAARLEEAGKKWKLKDLAVERVADVGDVLKKSQNAVSTDGDVLDHCPSWLNLAQLALAKIPDARRIRLETPRAATDPNEKGEKKDKK
jgi:hypothetical protein